MRNLLILISIIYISLLSCRKQCRDTGQFIIPAFISVTEGDNFIVNNDTIAVSIRIPIYAYDVRDSAQINLYSYPQSLLHLVFSYRTRVRSENNSIPLDLIQEGVFEVLNASGEIIKGSELWFNYEVNDGHWQIRFYLVPKIYLEGIFSIYFGVTNFKNDCLLIQPNYVFENPEKNWHLLTTHLGYEFRPWQNTYFFSLSR